MTTSETHPYVCSKCEAHGVRLYRQYQTFADRIQLLCTACALIDQKKSEPDETHTIGWLVAACPSGDTFWGYTNVPKEIVDWWNALPVTADARPAVAWARGPLTMMAQEEQIIRRDLDALGREQQRRLCAEIDALRQLPVITTCGECRHRDESDGACLHPNAPLTSTHSSGFHHVDEKSIPPGWCPLRGTP